MLRALARLWRRPQVTSAGELLGFVKAESAFLAQKTTVEYCRARAGMNWDKLFKEDAFATALEVCRWEAMAAVLADMLIVTEGFLRPHAGPRADRLGGRLAAWYGEILWSYPASPERRQGWTALEEAFPARMARAQLGPPHAAAEIARTAGARVYDLLPIHRSLRSHDREMIINAVRFGMVAYRQKLQQAVADPAALAAAVAAEDAAAGNGG